MGMIMYPWQKEFIEKMYKYKGKGIIQITGRNAGKSAFSSQALKRLMDDIWFSPLQNIVVDERRVHGARYHTAEPVGGDWREMEAWCRQSFGEPGDMWDSDDWVWPETARWMQNNRKFWFRNEEDLTMFILKWR